MQRQDAEPRASPAVPEELISLINETYKDDHAKALDIRIMIIEFVDHLNGQGRYEDAARFIREETAQIEAEAKRRRKEQRRKTLEVVARTSLPAIVLVVAKVIGSKLGFII